MFLPSDMTEDEKSLVAEVARNLLAAQTPTSPVERQRLRHQAEEIAAEMIWAARAKSGLDDEATTGPSDLVELEMAELEEQIEARQAENEAHRRRHQHD